MIALGLTEAPFNKDNDKSEKALDLALSRIRQLSAHEIGHTLGFAHNFFASANNRTSVMDYPHPNLSLNQGKIDYSKAYEIGIGDWDKVSVAFAYSDFPDEVDEDKALNQIIEKSLLVGHRFITDYDARPIGGAHPTAHLWDNGRVAYEELNKLLKIREIALNKLSLDHLRDGEPYSSLEDRMVPMYLLHRYQVEAVVKLIGGIDYDYGVKGSIEYKTKVVDATTQRNALKAYSNVLMPVALKIPDHLRTLLPPRSFSNPRTRENFLSQSGVAFDYLGIAHSLSNALLGMILHPERSNRLVTQYGFDSNQLGLKETLNSLITSHFKVRYRDGHEQQLNEIVKINLLKQIMYLGQNIESNSIVKAMIHQELISLDQWIAGQTNLRFWDFYRTEIDNYFENPNDFVPPVSKRLPDGSPIGSFSCDD